jgi:hypothetical protein
VQKSFVLEVRPVDRRGSAQGAGSVVDGKEGLGPSND